MANPFAIRTETEGDIRVLSVEGFLDAHTAPEFEKAIESELAAGNYRLVAECSKLTYISSAGLGVFMGFIEEIREKGGDIKICGLSPKVFGVFDILGFPEIYDITEDRAGAVQRFAEAPTREA